jgi:hypothetical protein
MKPAGVLFSFSIVFFVLYDVISTIAALNYLGTFEYEKSFLLKASFGAAGVPGFILIKMIFSLLALGLAYMLVERFNKFRGVGLGILAGATAAGLFVGTSNFNIILNNSSFWLMGLDSGTIAAILILVCALAGYLIMPSKKLAGVS